MEAAAVERAKKLTQIAEAVWDPTDAVACEASCALHHAAHLTANPDNFRTAFCRFLSGVLS